LERNIEKTEKIENFSDFEKLFTNLNFCHLPKLDEDFKEYSEEIF